MSGFIAVFQLDGAPVDRTWLAAATASLAFRGPDAQQIWCAGPVGLGHALLLCTHEAAHEQQPLTFDEQVWLVGDVRVDGRAELIGQLRARGRVVAGEAADADLMLHAYLVWGEACLEHLSGDFAFVIWDARSRRLWAARDHFGVTPFYYALAGGALLLSNTLNALRLHPAVADTLDEETVGEYLLTSLYPASEATMFRAIRRLRPAHRLAAELGGGVQTQRYWAPPEWVPITRYRRSEEYVEHFRGLFEQAVGDRLRTPAVAGHLSGGMDSGSIMGTAQRLLHASGQPYDLRGYSLVFRSLIPDDEGDYAQQVAERCGFSTEMIAIDDFFMREPIAPPPHLTPEPFGLPGQVTQQEAAERAARFCRVLLEGFGGDPLFSPRHRPPLELWRAGSYRAAARGLLRPLVHRVRGKPGGLPPGVTYDLPAWYEPAFSARTHLAGRWQTWLHEHETLPDAQRDMAGAGLWESIFIMADAAFTGLPLKTRWPFFDLRLYNFMLSIPPEPWCRAKHLLRRAMRGTLPETVLQRRKTPLRGQPQAIALQRNGGVPAWMHDLAAAPELAPFVDRRRLALALKAPTGLTQGSLGQVITVMTLAYWMRHQRRPLLQPWLEGGEQISRR